MKLIPHIWRLSASTTDPTDDSIPDYDGWEIGIAWLGLLVTITFARREK